MASTLLKSAKNFQKAHEWKEAITCFEQYMKETKGTCSDDIYVSYAKCLRVVGYTSHAEELLIEGKALHPDSERILRELHNLHDSTGNWSAAKSVANTLVKINPEQANYHFLLGRTYSYLNNFKKAEESYKTGLKYKHGVSFERLIERIQRGFSDHPTDVSSEYIFINGRNNLGAFIHKDGDKKYFTKITRYTRGARREETFYKNLCREFPTLKQTVPLYIDSQVIDKILYLTLEMIDDIPVKSEHLNDIILTSSQISTIKYKDLINAYPNPNYLFQLRNRPISAVFFFTQIDKKFYNERLFSALYKLAEQNNYPIAVNKVINRLESLIMDNYLYAFINPEQHYSLLHGDFIPQNIKMQKDSETPIVFDWATFTVGPRFIDIARYLTTTFTPYTKIKEDYLFNEHIDRKLSVIEQIFFLYASIIFYLLTNRRKSLEARLSDFILPALNDMEILVRKFKENEYDSAIQSILEEREEDKVKVIQLEQRIHKLKQENEQLQNRFKGLLNSKSWRITSPLRKIGQWREWKN